MAEGKKSRPVNMPELKGHFPVTENPALLTHYEWDVVDYPSFRRTASGPRGRGAAYKFPVRSIN